MKSFVQVFDAENGEHFLNLSLIEMIDKVVDGPEHEKFVKGGMKTGIFSVYRIWWPKADDSVSYFAIPDHSLNKFMVDAV